MVKTFLKSLWRRFHVFCSDYLLISSETLSRRHEIFQLLYSILKYIYSFFLRSFSLTFMHRSVLFINRGFKCFEYNFFILKFHFLIILLNFITSKYSLFRQKYYLGMLPLFPDMPSSWSAPCKYFLYCSGSTYSNCTEDSDQSSQVIFEEFCFLASSFSIFNNNILYFFAEICDLHGNSWSDAPFSCFNP